VHPDAGNRHAGRKVIITLDGGDAWAPAKPQPDETLILALARAHRWRRLIEDGTYRSAVEIAEAEKITRSFVNRLLRITLLAPNIQEAILDGRQPKGIQLEELARSMPSSWEKQEELVQFRLASSASWDVAPTFSWINSPERALCYGDDQSGHL
jgi:hypothetical protein